MSSHAAFLVTAFLVILFPLPVILSEAKNLLRSVNREVCLGYGRRRGKSKADPSLRSGCQSGCLGCQGGCSGCQSGCLGCQGGCLGCQNCCSGCQGGCSGCQNCCLGCQSGCLGCQSGCLGCQNCCLGCESRFAFLRHTAAFPSHHCLLKTPNLRLTVVVSHYCLPLV